MNDLEQAKLIEETMRRFISTQIIFITITPIKSQQLNEKKPQQHSQWLSHSFTLWLAMKIKMRFVQNILIHQNVILVTTQQRLQLRTYGSGRSVSFADVSRKW